MNLIANHKHREAHDPALHVFDLYRVHDDLYTLSWETYDGEGEHIDQKNIKLWTDPTITRRIVEFDGISNLSTPMISFLKQSGFSTREVEP